MGKELGLSPRRLLKNIPLSKQKWKLPVKDWIEELYAKRFKKPERSKEINPKVDSPTIPT